MTGYTPDRIPVFAGPSLAGWVAAPPFERLPPAGAGDMMRLIDGAPCTVVLIDGVFDARPAVWHKEILMLLAHGFRVIGAASMGALRAAELDSFGMIGCGAVYRAYADGRITGDDEVAVLHAPAALGGRPLSLAQVNVRATLCRAVRTATGHESPTRLSPPGQAPMPSTSRRKMREQRLHWRWNSPAKFPRGTTGRR